MEKSQKNTAGQHFKKARAVEEKELKEKFEDGLVTLLSLVEVDKGFKVFASTARGDLVLTTQRGNHRVWKSLDRLKLHIQRKYQHVPISLYLK